MSKEDELREMLVAAIIGDIPVVFTLDETDREWKEFTDEEIAEFEAYERTLPEIELTPEQERNIQDFTKRFVGYIGYKIECEAVGVEPLDFYEWDNMEIKPLVIGE